MAKYNIINHLQVHWICQRKILRKVCALTQWFFYWKQRRKPPAAKSPSKSNLSLTFADVISIRLKDCECCRVWKISLKKKEICSISVYKFFTTPDRDILCLATKAQPEFWWFTVIRSGIHPNFQYLRFSLCLNNFLNFINAINLWMNFLM